MATRPSVVFQFSTSGGYGWSERYWYTVDAADLATVASVGLQLLGKRMKCAAANVVILNAYASHDDEFRDTVPCEPLPTIDKAASAWNKDFTADQIYCDMPWTSVDIRCWSGPIGSKHIFLAGCPDFDLTMPAKPQKNFTVALNAALTAYGNELIKNWGWKGRSPDVAVSPKVNITNIGAEVAGLTEVTVTSTNNFKPGRPVKIKDVMYLGEINPNRNWTIANIIGATSFHIKTGGVSITYAGGGTAQCLNPGIMPITKFKIVGATHRKRGVGPARVASARKRV